MFRGLTGLLGAAVERRLHDCLFGVVATAVVGLFATVSLGFGTFAAYATLGASEGRVVAALIVGAAYGLTAIAIWGVWAARRHAGRPRRAAAAAAPAASSGTVDSLLQSLAAGGTSPDQPALIAAMRLGRELAPMELLALALLGGFIAGRKLDKRGPRYDDASSATASREESTAWSTFSRAAGAAPAGDGRSG